jgi:hypothetical protein
MRMTRLHTAVPDQPIPDRSMQATSTNSLTRGLVALLLALLVATGAAPAAFGDTSGISTSDLVANYEQQQPFRGTANHELVARGGRLRLGVVEVLTGVTGQLTGRDGYVELGSTGAGATLVAASDGPGMDRFGLVINDRHAEQHRFRMVLPDDATVTHQPTGAIDIHSRAGDTTLAPAMAVDANGNQVPARYQITEKQLVVDVELDNAALPVFVDPVTSYYWWGFTEWYSRSDVRWQADWWSVARVASNACRFTPGHLQSICRATVGRYTSWIYNTWQHAKNTNQCLAMSMTWTGQVTNIYAYPCNWG